MAALEIWRRWPREIEFDLLNLPTPLDIADWLQGTCDDQGRMKLSSRRLLMILERLPDTSQFMTWAVRNGDWTHDQSVAARTHNVIAKWVAGYLAARGVEGDDALWFPIETPLERMNRWLVAEREFLDESEDAEPDLIGSLFGK